MSLNSKNEKIILTYRDVLSMYKSEYHGIKALSQYTHWFPIKSSAKLAGVVADLMGDGHLQDPKFRIDYTSNSTKELKRFDDEIFNLFGINGKIRDCTTNKYNTKNLGINNKPLGRVLKLIGVPGGAKVLITFSIPNWILRDKVNFTRFINRLMSCEGCIDLQYKYIELRMHKSLKLIEDGKNFFNDIKKYLDKYFSIKTTNVFLAGKPSIRKDGIKTKAIRIKIKRKDSVLKYRNYIGFDNEIKKKKLDAILEF